MSPRPWFTGLIGAHKNIRPRSHLLRGRVRERSDQVRARMRIWKVSNPSSATCCQA